MGDQENYGVRGLSKCHDNTSDSVLKQQRVFQPLGKTNLRPQQSVNRWKLSVPYKAELCRLFQRGNCYYGENCHFSHSIGKFGKPCPDTEEDKTTMKQCKWFASGMNCPYGDTCQYVHVIEGCAGPLLHTTRLCRMWMKYGKCLHGEQCIYAHGVNELPCPRHGNASCQKHLALESIEASSFSAAPSYNVAKNAADKKKLKLTGIYGDWIDEDGETIHTNLF